MSQRALRLHEKHSRAELVQLQERVKEQNDGTGEGLHRYNRTARKMLDDIGWAIYWHDAPQGNTRMAPAKPKAKWW